MLWADACRRGLPTASADALYADVILAACAANIGQRGDQIIVATQRLVTPNAEESNAAAAGPSHADS
jgi:hypothetical protein